MAGQEQIDQFLQSLSFEGDHQSGGTFTISPEKARAKFREFGLSEPHYYTGLLVSALLSEGATFVDIEADSDDFIVTSDYVADRQGLEQLFSLASQEEGRNRVFRLALGLQASLALDPQKVELACWDGAVGAVLKLGEESFQVSPLDDPGWPEKVRSRIHVREKPGLRVAARFLKSTLAGQTTEEQSYLKERFRLASVPITLNGDPLNDPVDLSRCQAWLRLGPRGYQPVVPPKLPGPPLLDVETEEFSAYIGFPTRAPQRAETTLVVHGLIMPGWNFPHADLAIVYCDGLTTDLSLTRVVHDRLLEQMEQKLETAIREALPKLFAGPLRDQDRFPSRNGVLSYEDLKSFYERDGFLTVVTNDSVQVSPYGEAPLVRAGSRFLDLLFPNQVLDTQILKLVPPGRYRARRFSEMGSELALAFEPRLMGGEFSTPRWVVHGWPEPTLNDVLVLYETQPGLELDEGLELLRFVMVRSRGAAYELRRVMDDPDSPFKLDPESWLSRLVAALQFPTRDGKGVSLEALVYGHHSGVCWTVFTDYPLRFHEPPAETVMLPIRYQEPLTGLVGFSIMKFNREVRTGLINLEGEFVCEPDLVNFKERMSCGRLLYSADELWGYVDDAGRVAIEASYREASDFEEGSAVVSLAKDEYLLIDVEGERLAGPYGLILDLRDGLRLAHYKGRWGYLNPQGEIVIPFELESGGHFGEGQALAKRERRRVLIDKLGQVVGDCHWDYDLVGPLGNGLRLAKHKGLFGYLDRSGQWAIEPQYEMGWGSNGQLVPVKSRGYWGLVDHRGETVVPFIYDRMATRFSEGLLAVERAGKHGYLDCSGEEVLEGFEAAGPFSQGVAPAQDGRWGYINKKGFFVIPPRYLAASPFHEDRAVVKPYNF